MIGQTISHYKITEKLGGGGMGVVYKALDTKLDRPVALKFLPPELTRDPGARRRFAHEAKAASALQHHNICTIHEIDETGDGRMFISMDCYEGETLKQKIARGPLPIDEAIDIASQVGEGLAKAHEAGVVHRDIKPANIIITSDGVVKIVDFGLAKLAGQTRVTKTGATVGTVSYMSPEQAKGEEIDHRSDIFSLGVVLYELIAGEVPFKGDHEAAVLYGIIHNDPEPVSKYRGDVPEELKRVIETALSKDLGTRYQDASEVVENMNRCRTGRLSTERSTSGIKTVRLRTLTITMMSILIIICGYFIYSHYLTLSSRESEMEIKRIAILPFENLGPAEDEYFASGMTEEITARLAGIQELGIIARTSAVQYKNTNKGIREIGQELGVDYIMEGTVRWQRSSDKRGRVRITPRLIRVADGTHVWAEIYDESLMDIFKVQTDVAKQVVAALNVTLLDRERDYLVSQPTDNVEALDNYMRGNNYFGKRHVESARRMRTAIEFYERAILADPEFASGYAMLAWVYTELYWHRDSSEENKKKAASAIEKAMSLRPEAFIVRLVHGVYEYHFLRYDRALDELTSLLELHPNNAELLAETAYAHTRKGDWEQSIVLLKKALVLDPRSYTMAYELASRYRLVRRFGEAEIHYERALELAPDYEIVHIERALLYLSRDGDSEGAKRILADAAKVVDPSLRFHLATAYVSACAGDYPETQEECFKSLDSCDRIGWYLSSPGVWGAALEIMGEHDRAMEYYKFVITTIENQDRQDWFGFYSSILGIAYAGLGRKDEAIAKGRNSVLASSRNAWMEPLALGSLARIYVITEEYESAVNVLEQLLSIPGELSGPLLQIDPRWVELRDHPGFQRLLQQYATETDS